ncbi:MAG TPA: MoaD/ThiS family protein [Candidatus Binatia bacterium]|jgi:molybdopterin converting factor small subunit
MRVMVPTMLRSYTAGAAVVDASGSTLAELLDDLDRLHPGIRFRVIDEQERVRPHVRIFVDGEAARDVATALRAASVVQIVGALSGG